MDRRRFLLTSLAGALAAPFAAGAQQAGKVYHIGFLSLIPGENRTLMQALQQRLQELGYIDGKNLLFEYRSAEGRQERLADLASELVQARPDVLIAGAGTLAPLALKAATTTIPIVFSTCAIRQLTRSRSRPPRAERENLLQTIPKLAAAEAKLAKAIAVSEDMDALVAELKATQHERRQAEACVADLEG